MPFIHEDFLLSNKHSRYLYERYAAAEPILDYHCHLPPADVAANRQFDNLFEIWLEGDHYKWRAMRANGVDERFCTGDASPYEKFLAWARTVPHTLRNPLYHWTHLELLRYFGIDELLDENTAPRSGSGPTSNSLPMTCAPTASCASFPCAPSAPPTTPRTISPTTKPSPLPASRPRSSRLPPRQSYGRTYA